MTIPVSKITIYKGGNSKIESLEQVDDCHKLAEMAEAGGKVTSRKKKDHEDVFHDVQIKGVN